MFERTRSALSWAVDSYVLFVVLGVLLGAALAPAAVDTATGPDGTVAVVPIQGTIDGEQATEYRAMLAEARAEADAVVIVANSGGGSAAASESMYMQTLRLRESVPVVATVDGVAASGAYFAIAPADEVYVKPSSFVGSVGVLGTVPPDVEPNAVLGATGPDKVEGFGEREFFTTLETSRNAFVGSVAEHRGDRLELTENEVAAATIFGGSTAVDNGMADAIGDRRTAVAAAADRAGLDRPAVEVITPTDVGEGEWTATYALRATYHAGNADEKRFEPIRTADATRRGSFPTVLMAHPGAVEARDETLVRLDSRGSAAVPPGGAERRTDRTDLGAAVDAGNATNEDFPDAERLGGVPEVSP
ncbi:S49 family peptidase [Halorubrum rutilum]|uniref:S49 family peptidase n=1 Tax=Halorubrum rutilum TaxID=1364933 RepID=A0ABD6AN78_9EURY|nr:S49 family peptidase [Halorubrum rutilum]